MIFLLLILATKSSVYLNHLHMITWNKQLISTAGHGNDESQRMLLDTKTGDLQPM